MAAHLCSFVVILVGLLLCVELLLCVCNAIILNAIFHLSGLWPSNNK